MKRIDNRNQSNEKRLAVNTIFLYIMTFSSQFFGFLTVPYLTRILGPTIYGKVGIAMAYMAYAQIILDFGFILSATRKVADCQNDVCALQKLVTSVTVSKVLLSILLALVFGIYCSLNANIRNDWSFYMMYLAAYVINALLPDFFYRGIEEMKIITYRTCVVKALSTMLTFVLIRTEADYYLIPFFNLIGNLVALIWMYCDMSKKYGIHYVSISKIDIRTAIKDTIPYFVSRAASTTYQALNTIVLNMLYGDSPIVGYYSSADKIITLGKTASSPIADSLFPYMVRNKNYKLIKKLLFILMPVIIIGVTFVFVYAQPICILLFGSEYADASQILRCLLPILIVILPTYVFCFPVMVPLGLTKWANISNVIGMTVQLFGLALLHVFGHLNVYSLCLLSSTTEVVVCLFRVSIVGIHHVIVTAREKNRNQYL